jgi:hypothetical protein
LSRSEIAQLHVDTQPYPGLTRHAAIIRFPGITPFAVECAGLNEIMADKIIALCRRRYLSGRDLFDLWFHWLSQIDQERQALDIAGLLKVKIRRRGLSRSGLVRTLESRLGSVALLKRARLEWRRYLPPSFHKESVNEEIVRSARSMIPFLDRQ